MLHELPVVVSSSLRSAMLALVCGGIALVVAHRLERPAPRERTVELVLYAPVADNAFYASAWSHGPVHVVVDQANPAPITFTRTIHWVDHCDWVAHELLVPDGAGEYRYRYEEWPVSCAEGYAPFPATPRTGRVHAVPVDEARAASVTLTPMIGAVRYHGSDLALRCPFLQAHGFGE